MLNSGLVKSVETSNSILTSAYFVVQAAIKMDNYIYQCSKESKLNLICQAVKLDGCKRSLYLGNECAIK